VTKRKKERWWKIANEARQPGAGTETSAQEGDTDGVCEEGDIVCKVAAIVAILASPSLVFPRSHEKRRYYIKNGGNRAD
jgi:hypothetical protein